MAVGITRVAFEVACWAGPIGLPLARLWYGWWGVLVWTCLEGLTIIGDYFISPKMENNLARLERIGYSRTQLYVLMYANLFWPNALIAGLQQIFCGGSAPWNTMDVRIDAQLISIIAVNLVLADVFFTLAHSIVLHKTKLGASFHKIHHCAKPCSWSYVPDPSYYIIPFIHLHSHTPNTPLNTLYTLYIRLMHHCVVGPTSCFIPSTWRSNSPRARPWLLPCTMSPATRSRCASS